MFKELLNIKHLREKTAAAAVARAKAVVRERQEAVGAAKAAVEEFHAFRLDEEVRLFEKIKGTGVKVEKIDEMKFEITTLRAREEELKKKIEEAEDAVREAERAVENAEDKHREAEKAVQKYEELVQNEADEAAKAAMQAEDAEIEEVSEAIFAIRSANTGGT